MVDFLIHLDQQLTFFLKNLLPHNYFFDLFFSFFSLAGASFFIWVVVIVLIIILEELKNPGIQKTNRLFILYSFLGFGLSYLLNEVLLKNIFHRFRPFYFSPHFYLPTSCPHDFSFPSTHAVTAFTMTLIISYFDKKRRFFYYLIAFLIAYSRIYLGCHYFLDVFIGAILGSLISKIIINCPIFQHHKI